MTNRIKRLQIYLHMSIDVQPTTHLYVLPVTIKCWKLNPFLIIFPALENAQVIVYSYIQNIIYFHLIRSLPGSLIYLFMQLPAIYPNNLSEFHEMNWLSYILNCKILITTNNFFLSFYVVTGIFASCLSFPVFFYLTLDQTYAWYLLIILWTTDFN